MVNRRRFLSLLARTGICSATAPRWLDALSVGAMAQAAGSYKAIVVVSMPGGNDGNNTVIPLDNARYRQYASLRPSLAIPQSACIPLSFSANGLSYGLHPSLVNVAKLYNSGVAMIAANVGPVAAPVTKATLTTNSSAVPAALLSHPAGRAQWESSSTSAEPATGWGGRMADLLASSSGSLPPVLDASLPSIFTVGRSVQGIMVSGASSTAVALPAGMNDAILALAKLDANSSNRLVSLAGSLRTESMQQQALLAQAQASGTPLKSAFPNTGFGQTLKTIANVINGRSVVGASRQIFYAQQGNSLYDTHGNQLSLHNDLLSELDGGLGAFMQALAEMNLTSQVLVCTLSDFNRTMVPNGSGGTDHAWGNHQFLLGGGIRGGRIAGTFPDLDLGGAMDLGQSGIWIPGLSVTEMTAGIGGWMGLSNSQLLSVFPDLGNFAGPMSLS